MGNSKRDGRWNKTALNVLERRDAMTRHNEKGLLRDRRGAVAVWAALMLVMLVGVAALVIDMGYLWVLRDRLQSTADAAALAGASQLGIDEASVKAEAVAYARKNLLPGAHGKVLCTAGADPALAADCPDGELGRLPCADLHLSYRGPQRPGLSQTRGRDH